MARPEPNICIGIDCDGFSLVSRAGKAQSWCKKKANRSRNEADRKTRRHDDSFAQLDVHAMHFELTAAIYTR
jgi:hypothetical protein